MANLIHQYAYNPGQDIFYDAGFQRVLEANLSLIAQHPLTVSMDTPRDGAQKYEGDLHLALAAMGVVPWLWWITMRVNGYTSPVEYNDDKFSLLVPDGNLLENMRAKHVTRYGNLG